MKTIFGFPFAVFKKKKKKRKVKSNPTCIPANSSFSNMSVNPLPAFHCGAIGNIVINIERAAVHRPQKNSPEEAELFTHLLEPEES